jgi:hypothetical protein
MVAERRRSRERVNGWLPELDTEINGLGGSQPDSYKMFFQSLLSTIVRTNAFAARARMALVNN